MGDGISTCPQMGPTKGGADDAPNATLICASPPRVTPECPRSSAWLIHCRPARAWTYKP